MPRSSRTKDYSGRAVWRLNDNNLVYARYQFSNFMGARRKSSRART